MNQWFDAIAEAYVDVRRLEHELEDARRRRAMLALRLARDGRSEREIAAPLGVESPHINQWKRLAERGPVPTSTDGRE